MLPTFIVIGAAKCGTTSLCDLLGRHPDVFISTPKEPHFFSRQKDTPETRFKYESLFSGVTTESAIGEGSTSYAHPYFIGLAARGIHSSIPSCRLIYMVRHPLRRLESDWKMKRHERRTPASINLAVSEDRRLKLHGMYWKNLQVYRAMFSDEQLLIVFLEDFSKDPERELARCFEHIGVDSQYRPENASSPRNTAQNRRQDGRAARLLRLLPFFDQLKESIPPSWVTAAKELLTRKKEYDVVWDEEVLRALENQYVRDSQRLLSFCDKPLNYWDLGRTGD